MSPPTKECSKCGHLMVCIQDEILGRDYWCGYCLHEETVHYGHCPNKEDRIYESTDQRLSDEN